MTQRPRPPVALTIAGSDSCGGAGLQADLKTWAALGLYGCSVVTCVTAQSTTGVTGVTYLDADFIVKQLQTVVADLPVAALKIGMLGRVTIIHAVDQALTEMGLKPLVLDPVMVSKAGSALLEDEAVAAMTLLMRHASMVTPNRFEAARLTQKPCETLNGGKIAAQEIQSRFGCEAVVVKGFQQGEEVVDVFYDGMRLIELRGPLGPTDATHGSGCTLSAAIAGYLARGEAPYDAALRAKTFTNAAILQAYRLGRGPAPVNQFALQPRGSFDAVPEVRTTTRRESSTPRPELGT
jgi:hydroxymethylpyrimidine/phosphomethylpyrimidine kinase